MKKVLWMLLLAVFTCAFLAGCSIEEREEPQMEQENYNFYYMNTGETSLKKEIYEPQEETTDFMLKDLMQRLSSKDAPEDGIALLPEAVSVNSYDLQEKRLIVDFNSGYLEMSRAREVLTRAGIVKMFLQIPDIEAVRFTVEGQELTDSRNQAVGDMTEDTFVEFSGKDNDAYRYDTFTLYFTDKSGKKTGAGGTQSLLSPDDAEGDGRSCAACKRTFRGGALPYNFGKLPSDQRDHGRQDLLY